MTTSPHAITVPASVPLYRITSIAFHTRNRAHHTKVVNGRGGVLSPIGARYNFPGVVTVYLAEDLDACFAERMFYFQREVLRSLDISRHTKVIPSFTATFVLWEVKLLSPVANVYDVSRASVSHARIFPSMVLNPSQDYEHLKERRAHIQSLGYRGLRANSSRSKAGGKMVVLFDDQSRNVLITPYPVEFRLTHSYSPLSTPGSPFVDHTSEVLDFVSGEVRVLPLAPPPAGSPYTPYLTWQTIRFNH